MRALLLGTLLTTQSYVQCVTKYYEHCWVDAYGQTWCQDIPYQECATHNAGTGSGADPVLVLFLIALLLAPFFFGKREDSPDVLQEEIEQDTVTLEELTARVEAAAKEADEYIERMKRNARTDADQP